MYIFQGEMKHMKLELWIAQKNALAKNTSEKSWNQRKTSVFLLGVGKCKLVSLG